MYDRYMRDEDIRRLRGQLKALQRRLRREAQPIDGLSTTTLQVLAAVERAGAATTPGQVTAELQMTTSNVAAALRTLETAGLVVRRRDPHDGRRAFVHPTDRGREVVSEHRRERDAWLGRAVDALLTEDEQRLLLAAGELMQRLAAHGQDVV
jgi:DNA-binding MarR family transcriptional regulator